MKRNKKRVIAAVAVVCALAAGGAAFTNEITTSSVTNANAGYGSVTVKGGETLSSVVYGFNTDGSQITSVNLTFAATLTSQYVAVAFNDNTGTTLQGGGTMLQPLSDSVCNSGNAVTATTVTCTLTTGVDTVNANNLDVLVTDNPHQ